MNVRTITLLHRNIRTFIISSLLYLYFGYDVNCSDGNLVLSTDWILDSLDARMLLPCKFYSVSGIAPKQWSSDDLI